ncbi:MAG: hypothetical protein E7294_10790 [Lachnospiraceae bacterium]|nr:hypothetical protein [Lachnospiraceae bacterium]
MSTILSKVLKYYPMLSGGDNEWEILYEITRISEEFWINHKEDKQRILERVTKLDYARAPKVFFAADQYDINKIIEETEDLTMIIGSSNESEIGMQKGILTANVTYPIKGRFVYNRTIAGYRGSLTLMEDLYDNM